MKFDPKDIVEHLRINLDRYPYNDGFTVFRELLQNADDAKAARVSLRLLDGWPQATNPLLKGSGLLLVNDGKFGKRSAEGMQTFGGSVKAADREAVGRFGLGQKSVFHICDAFVVIPHGYEESSAPFTVNPFYELRKEGDGCIQWNDITEQDAAWVIAAGEDAMPISPRLHMWFPLRRPGLRPKPRSRGIGERDIAPDELQTLADNFQLAKLLACLRHVREIEVSIGSARARVSRHDAPRLIGYTMKPGENSFGGDLGNGFSYVGREYMAHDDFCRDLRQSKSWPRVRNRQTDEEGPQKASPHGAVILVAGPETRQDILSEWAVLLPVSQAFAERLDDEKVPQLHVILHGCFFVDSGRRTIIGFNDDHNDNGSIKEKWNKAIRDKLVLPLLPSVLHKAFTRKILTNRQLAVVVRSIAGSDFGRHHKAPIARRHVLAQVIETSKKGAGIIAVWRLIPGDAALRPLPSVDSQGKVAFAELKPDLLTWAAQRDLTLVCEPEALLASTAPRWKPEELIDLIGQLDPAIFTSPRQTSIFVEMLRVAVGDDAELRNAIADSVLRLLRRALASEHKLAPHEEIRKILNLLEQANLLGLPRRGATRSVMRILARVEEAPLCLPDEWLDEEVGHRASILAEDAYRLIKALQPLLKRADASAVAAAATILRSVDRIDDALAHPELKGLPAIRVIDGLGARLISIAYLEEASRDRRVFRDDPKARKYLPLLAKAIPGCEAFILPQEIADILGDVKGLETLTLSVSAVAHLVSKARDFGSEEARAELLSTIAEDVSVHRREFRALAAGDHRAGNESAQLLALPKTTENLERLVLQVISNENSQFLVSDRIVDRLERKKVHQLGIQELSREDLGGLLSQHIQKLDAVMDEDLATEILDANFRENQLKQLPIIKTNRGSWACPNDVWKEEDWPIPKRLRTLVLLPAVTDNVANRHKIERLIATWSPSTQLAFCLRQDTPSDFATEILEALKAIESVDEEQKKQLRKAKWLSDLQGRAWAPEDILDLPDDVLAAARKVLEDETPFLLITDIASELRDHDGFKLLREYEILPDEEGSIERLLLIVAEIHPPAWLGERCIELQKALQSLAEAGKDLPAPGWPLLKALLKRVRRETASDPESLLEAFGEIETGNIEQAIQWLKALANEATAAAGKKRSKAAYEAYACGFQRLVECEPDDIQKVLSEVQVPTRDGTWRPACEVVAWVDGIASAHRLDEKLERIWPRPDVRQDVFRHDRNFMPAGAACKPDTQTYEKLEECCATTLEPVIKHISSEFSSDAAVLLLGIIRRTEKYENMAKKTGMPIERIERIWKQLEDIENNCHIPTRPGGTLRNIRYQTLLYFSLEQPETMEVETLTGNWRKLPTELEPLSIIGHRQRRRISFGDRENFWLHRVRISDVSRAVEKQHLRRLLHKLASECLDFQSACLEGLDSLLDECLKTEQTTVEDVRARLQDRLPSILAQLKPQHDTALGKILHEYERKELAQPAEKLPENKQWLWGRLNSPRATAQLLTFVRKAIESYGYGPSRVIFELFQNADDANLQHEPPFIPDCRVELTANGIRFLHWGRQINNLGPDPEKGEQQRWQHDLFNMLIMNFSEKREAVTGRFGLGFKSVHLVAQEVRIGSGSVSCRIIGGMLPEVWDEGRRLSFEFKRKGRRATIIELDRDAEKLEDMQRALEAFGQAVRWLPAMARKIRQITFDGKLHSAYYEKLGPEGIHHVRFEGVDPGHALALSLDEDTTLFLPVGPDGPQPAPQDLPRLWLLTPLEEECTAGWLLNSFAFRVDPGRGRLAGTSEDRAALFRRLGKILGKRLVELHDLVRENWENLAQKTGMVDSNPRTGAPRFLEKLIDLLKMDLKDPLATHLHEEGGGLHRLLSDRPALPTGMPAPFAPFLRLKDIRWVIAGPLSDTARLEGLKGWKAIDAMAQHTVGQEAASLFNDITNHSLKKFDAVALLKKELEPEKRVDPNTAKCLGKLFDEEFLQQAKGMEEQNILKEVSRLLFKMEDGSWKKAGLPPRNARDADEEERKILAFAPVSEVADPAYKGSALHFYRLAARQSGVERTARVFAHWAHGMQDEYAQRALLRYVLEGRQGENLGRELENDRPSWMPSSSEEMRHSKLIEDFSNEERGRLLSKLYINIVESIGKGSYDEDIYFHHEEHENESPDPESALYEVLEWWEQAFEEEREKYHLRVWPREFDMKSLGYCESDKDRIHWFTFFALGIFRTLPWGQEAAHKKFIEASINAGWWQEMALAELPEDFEPWKQQLEAFADSRAWRIDFPQWRRAMVDLYALARWLPDYAEAFLLLPQIVQKQGQIRLSDIWCISMQPAWQKRGLEGAPLTQSLGIGANWMIREAIRQELWEDDEANLMIPYAWSSTRRVRQFFREKLGHNLGDRSDMNLSPKIFTFLQENLGEKSVFLGDLDLPLQIYIVDCINNYTCENDTSVENSEGDGKCED